MYKGAIIITRKNTVNKLFLFGIIVIFLIGSLFHSVYDFLGEGAFLAIFFPVNESIFEHIKIAILPIFVWYCLCYFFKRKELDINKWFTSALLSMLLAGFLVPVFYYFFTGSFGFESVAVDIISFALEIAIAQLIARHYYRYGKGICYKKTLIFMIILIALVALGTFFPPKIPLFKEESSGTYGV